MKLLSSLTIQAQKNNQTNSFKHGVDLNFTIWSVTKVFYVHIQVVQR